MYFTGIFYSEIINISGVDPTSSFVRRRNRSKLMQVKKKKKYSRWIFLRKFLLIQTKPCRLESFIEFFKILKRIYKFP